MLIAYGTFEVGPLKPILPISQGKYFYFRATVRNTSTDIE